MWKWVEVRDYQSFGIKNPGMSMERPWKVHGNVLVRFLCCLVIGSDFSFKKILLLKVFYFMVCILLYKYTELVMYFVFLWIIEFVLQRCFGFLSNPPLRYGIRVWYMFYSPCRSKEVWCLRIGAHSHTS